MRKQKWEVNGQKKDGSTWESVKVNSSEDAEKTAQTWAKMGWVNVNWASVNSGGSQDRQVAWVVRNGKKS